MSIPLGNAIRAARLRKRLKQWEIAEFLKVTRAAVGQWEAGTNEPSAQKLLLLNQILDLDLFPASQIELSQRRRSEMGTDRDANVMLNPTAEFDIPVSHVVMDEEAYVLKVFEHGGAAYVRRFDFFVRNANIFAMIFATNSLSPRYEQNDIVYVEPGRKPLIGEYGVFTVRAQKDQLHPIHIARRVAYADQSRMILSRFRPDRQDEFSLEAIDEVGRVIPELELVRPLGK